MKHTMKLARRAFASIIGCSILGLSQTRLKRLTEDEWQSAYDLARHAKSDRPKSGFVPNAEIAERIGEAVASGLYGESTAAQERPFRARLNGDVWTVMGTLPHLSLGGVAIIQINRDDGRILFAHHTQ